MQGTLLHDKLHMKTKLHWPQNGVIWSYFRKDFLHTSWQPFVHVRLMYKIYISTNTQVGCAISPMLL